MSKLTWTRASSIRLGPHQLAWNWPGAGGLVRPNWLPIPSSKTMVERVFGSFG